MSRLRRFLHLERPRTAEAGEPGAAPVTAGRFGGVERPGRGPEAPQSSGAGLGRFGPEPSPAIEILETGHGERPFTRCMRCGMDHHVLATECSGCGASLDTAAQRDFDERLWARRREEAEQEARDAAARGERRAGDDAELEAARRAMGEELAREVGRRERLRLGMGGGAWGDGSGHAGHPLGLRLLRALPDWRWRLVAMAAAVGAVAGLLAYGMAGHPAALLAGIAAVIVLVVPNWRANSPP